MPWLQVHLLAPRADTEAVEDALLDFDFSTGGGADCGSLGEDSAGSGIIGIMP